jgi:hypothetical protein
MRNSQLLEITSNSNKSYIKVINFVIRNDRRKNTSTKVLVKKASVLKITENE